MDKAKQAVTGQSPYERGSMPQQMGAGGMGAGVGTVGATGQPIEGQLGVPVRAGYPSATAGQVRTDGRSAFAGPRHRHFCCSHLLSANSFVM
jgi:hypothetical protein